MLHKIQTYDRHSTAPLETIIAEILASSHLVKTTVKTEVNGQRVGIDSLRLRTFAHKGCKCVKCGLEAAHFAVERDLATAARGGNYHLNLWGVKDGVEVLFTHDHILARGLGGKDRIENTQTMCCFCNWEKGEVEQLLAQQLRAQK